MTLQKKVNLKRFLKVLNSSNNISATCMEFGISDGSLHYFLRTRGKKLVKKWKFQVLPVVVNKLKNKQLPIIDLDAFIQHLNESKSKVKTAKEFGLSPTSLSTYFNLRNLKIITEYDLEELDTK